MDDFLANGLILQAVPGADRCGSSGRPVLARELETGTFTVRLDAGLRPGCAGRSASWCRSRVAGGRRRRSPQRAVVLGTTSRTSPPANQTLSLSDGDPVLSRPCSDLRGVGFAAWNAGRTSRSAAWPACSSAGSSPRLSPPLAALRRARLRRRGVPAPALPGAAGHQPTQRARFRVDHEPVGDQGRQGSRTPASLPATSSGSSAVHFHRRRASPRLQPLAGCLSRHGYTPVDQLPARQAGSGHSSGSRAAGCSRCQCCSSPRPSGWSAAGRPEPPASHPPMTRGPRPTCQGHPPGICHPSHSGEIPLLPGHERGGAMGGHPLRLPLSAL